MPQKTLKDAIQKARTKGTATPENMTLFLRQIAKEVLAGNMAALEKDLRDYAEQTKATLLAEGRAAIAKSLEINWDKLRGAPGTPGEKGKDAVAPPVDIQAIARHAATLVKPAVIDLDAVAHKVVPLMRLPAMKTPKDGSPDTPEQIIEKIHASKKKIKLDSIEGLPKALTSVNMSLREKNNIARQFGGGGDSVAAGAGVTITTVNHTKVISVTGAGLSIIVVAGTVDDSNKTFTSAAEPTLLNINGAFYQKAGGAYTWTYVGTTITLNQPVGLGGQIFGI